MTIDASEIPEEPPTPKPWEDDELSVRQGLRLFASHVLEELRRMRGTLELELRGIHVALDKLEERHEDTGRHIIQIAELAGEAKGAAQAAHRKSLPPVLRLVNWLGSTLAEHWASHVVVLAAGALVGWLLHHAHMLP